MNKARVTWHVNEMGSVSVACITKSVNHWIYSYEVSLADLGIEWIHVAACIFVATGLNT